MRDRAPTYPGRVTLLPVPGQPYTYDMSMADEPTEEGTALNKANLLSDATEIAIWGNAADRTVSDALAELGALKFAQGTYIGTGAFGVGSPNTIMFDFRPDIVFIKRTSQSLQNNEVIFIRPEEETKPTIGSQTISGDPVVRITWGSNSVTWYSTTENFQKNMVGYTYSYFAIGE